MHNIITGLLPLAVSIEDSGIRLLDGNARVGDIESVKRSLAEFGQRKPIVVREDTGEIEAGNHTFMAAVQLGWTEIAAVYVNDDETRAKAFALADNRTSELGVMDEELLAAMVRDVMSDRQLIEAASYDDDAIAKLLASEEEDDGDDGPTAPPAPVVAYNLIFDDEDQQAVFYGFIRWLKGNQSGSTVSERLVSFIKAQDLA